GFDPVAREHPCRRPRRTVVDDDGDIRSTGRLQPGGDTGRAEALGCRDAQGATPSTGSPVVSGRPSAMLAFWIACPAAPLPRLSSAATTTARPLSLSATACR